MAYGSDDRVSNCDRVSQFSLLQIIQTNSGGPLSLLLRSYRDYFMVVKAAGDVNSTTHNFQGSNLRMNAAVS